MNEITHFAWNFLELPYSWCHSQAFSIFFLNCRIMDDKANTFEDIVDAYLAYLQVGPWLSIASNDIRTYGFIVHNCSYLCNAWVQLSLISLMKICLHCLPPVFLLASIIFGSGDFHSILWSYSFLICLISDQSNP